MGRPSSYTPEVAAEICELLSAGKSLRQVCLTPGMPARDTILRWAEQSPEFQVDLARARETCADFHADEGLRVLTESMGQSKEHVAAAREIAKYHLSLARVIDSKRYGDQSRFQVEHSGTVGPMQVVVNVVRSDPTPKVIDVFQANDALPESAGEHLATENSNNVTSL
jgi:hypothetical protein